MKSWTCVLETNAPEGICLVAAVSGADHAIAWCYTQAIETGHMDTTAGCRLITSGSASTASGNALVKAIGS